MAGLLLVYLFSNYFPPSPKGKIWERNSGLKISISLLFMHWLKKQCDRCWDVLSSFLPSFRDFAPHFCCCTVSLLFCVCEEQQLDQAGEKRKKSSLHCVGPLKCAIPCYESSTVVLRAMILKAASLPTVAYPRWDKERVPLWSNTLLCQERLPRKIISEGQNCMLSGVAGEVGVERLDPVAIASRAIYYKFSYRRCMRDQHFWKVLLGILLKLLW